MALKTDFEDAVQETPYEGEWFIPTTRLFRACLYDNRDRGALKGTFARALYRSSTAHDLPLVWYLSFEDGGLMRGHDAKYARHTRLVRVELIPDPQPTPR